MSERIDAIHKRSMDPPQYYNQNIVSRIWLEQSSSKNHKIELSQVLEMSNFNKVFKAIRSSVIIQCEWKLCRFKYFIWLRYFYTIFWRFHGCDLGHSSVFREWTVRLAEIQNFCWQLLVIHFGLRFNSVTLFIWEFLGKV